MLHRAPADVRILSDAVPFRGTELVRLTILMLSVVDGLVVGRAVGFGVLFGAGAELACGVPLDLGRAELAAGVRTSLTPPPVGDVPPPANPKPGSALACGLLPEEPA